MNHINRITKVVSNKQKVNEPVMICNLEKQKIMNENIMKRNSATDDIKITYNYRTNFKICNKYSDLNKGFIDTNITLNKTDKLPQLGKKEDFLSNIDTESYLKGIDPINRVCNKNFRTTINDKLSKNSFVQIGDPSNCLPCFNILNVPNKCNDNKLWNNNTKII